MQWMARKPHLIKRLRLLCRAAKRKPIAVWRARLAVNREPLVVNQEPPAVRMAKPVKPIADAALRPTTARKMAAVAMRKPPAVRQVIAT